MYRPMVGEARRHRHQLDPARGLHHARAQHGRCYGWATRGIFDYSWQKVTKFRVDPGFYHHDITLLANHDTWTKKLNDAQRKLLLDLALEIEASTADVGLIEAERKKQEEAASGEPLLACRRTALYQGGARGRLGGGQQDQPGERAECYAPIS